MNRLILFFALIAFSIACRAQHIVYRMDRRPPAEIFAQGFVPPGNDANLYRHVTGETCYSGSRSSAFVSTTSDMTFARDWGSEITRSGRRFYVYRIRPTTRFYPTTISLLHAHSVTENPAYRLAATTFVEQREWASHGAIPANSVIDAVEFVSRGPLQAPQRIATHTNARYVQAATAMNARPYTWYYPQDDPDASPDADASCSSCFGVSLFFAKTRRDHVANQTIANVLACQRQIADQMSVLMSLFDEAPVIEEWKEKESL